MARVNIEERCFGDVRLFSLARKMNWDIAKALGVMTFIWHDSQEMLQAECSTEEILVYARVIPAEDAAKFISAISASRYVSRIGDDLFKIHGNSHQIDERVKKIRSGKKGGDATKSRWKKLTETVAKNIENKGETPSSATPTLGISPGSIQFNSIQPNSIQPKKRGRGPSLAPTPTPSECPPPPPRVIKFTESDRDIAVQWAEWAKTVSKTVKPNLDTWADVFRKMREIDKVPEEDFPRMLAFVQADPFWSPNAISVECLRARSRKNGLLKHENIRADMNRPTGKKSSKKLDDAYFASLPMEEEKWTSETSKN